MYNEVFVVGDIHGEYKKFKEILKYWDSNRQQLILLGDLCDRGLQSYECFYLAKYLCDNYGAILIKGNHEDLFLKFLNKTEDFKPLSHKSPNNISCCLFESQYLSISLNSFE
ncbi:metallophosphoesterase [Lactococcus lactis]